MYHEAQKVSLKNVSIPLLLRTLPGDEHNLVDFTVKENLQEI